MQIDFINLPYRKNAGEFLKTFWTFYLLHTSATDTKAEKSIKMLI